MTYLYCNSWDWHWNQLQFERPFLDLLLIIKMVQKKLVESNATTQLFFPVVARSSGPIAVRAFRNLFPYNFADIPSTLWLKSGKYFISTLRYCTKSVFHNDELRLQYYML